MDEGQDQCNLGDVFARTADAVFAMDAAHRVTFTNEAFARLCQRPPAVLCGRPCYEVLCGRSLDGAASCRDQCPMGNGQALRGTMENFDLAVPQPGGTEVWVNVGTVLSPPAWRPAEVVLILRPITLQKILRRFAGFRQSSSNQRAPDGVLSQRERQIVRLMVDGMSTRLIAETLHISYTTARNHIHNIFTKLGAHNRAEVVGYAFRTRLV